MPKLTLADIANLNNAQTVVNTINTNSAGIESAFEITLSRDGTQPNEMNATLDMNSNKIINLPEPILSHEAATKHYVDVHGGQGENGNGNGGTAGVISIDDIDGELTTGATLTMVDRELQTLKLTGDVSTADNSFLTVLGSKVVDNTNIADMVDASIKMNPLTDTGPVRDQRINNLTTISPLDPLLDWFLVHDTSAGTLNKVNATGIAAVSGVEKITATSGGSATGDVTFFGGAGIIIERPVNTNSIKITNTGGGGTVSGVDRIDGRTGEILLVATGGLDTNTANQMFIIPAWIKTGGSSYWFGGAGNTAATNSLLGIGPGCMSTATNLNLQSMGMGTNALQDIGLGSGSNLIGIGHQAMPRCAKVSKNIFKLAGLPVANDKVTIATTVYTFVTSATAAFQVKIGASVAATLQNLRDAINLTGTAGTNTYGVGTTIHPTVTAVFNDTVKLIINSKTANVANNSIICTDVGTNGSWHRATMFDGGYARDSVGLGANVLNFNLTSSNIGIGTSAGFNTTTADGNIYIGLGAGLAIKEGLGNNVYIGHQAGHAQNAFKIAPVNTHYNVGIGLFALQWMGYGTVTAAVPDPASTTENPLPPLTDEILLPDPITPSQPWSPQENTAVGATAGLSITTGNRNTALGANAMGGTFSPVHSDGSITGVAITGSENTALGENSFRNPSSASQCVAVGKDALTGDAATPNIGQHNVAVGHSALRTCVGLAQRNTVVGALAGGVAVPIPGPNNTGTGFTGDNNVFLGFSVARFFTSGDFNTVVGAYGPLLDVSNQPGITDGSNNTLIGARITGLGNVSGNVVLADGTGKKVFWWDGTNIKLPQITGTGNLQIDADKNIVAGPLLSTSGGTGQTDYVQGDILYASADDVLSRLPKDVTATRYLTNRSVDNSPKWDQVNLADGVTGNLNVLQLDGGANANIGTFWRGDGKWATPPGGGSGGVVGPAGTIAGRIATFADNTGGVIGDTIQGTATQVLHGGTNGTVSFSAVNITADTTGFLPTSRIALASPADGTRFLADDNTWKTPTGGGGGGGNVSSPGAGLVAGRIAVFTTTAGTSIDDTLVGTVNTVLHGGAGTDQQTFKAIDLASATVEGVLPAAKGGTGIASGTQGGIPYFVNNTQLGSTILLPLGALIVGGGIGAPIPLTPIDEAGQLLVGRTSPDVASWRGPNFGAFIMDDTGIAVMNTGQTYPNPFITGNPVQTNASTSQYVFFNQPSPLTATPDTFVVGKIRWDGYNTGNPIPGPAVPTIHPFAEFYGQVITSTFGAEDAMFAWRAETNGTFTGLMTLGVKTTAATSPDLEILAGNVVISGVAKGLQVTGTGNISTTSGRILTSTGDIEAGGALRTNAGIAPIGYNVGGFIEQFTSKISPVTLHASCGAVQMHPASLASGAIVTFTMTNSAVTGTDVVIVNQAAGTAGMYGISPRTANGSIQFTIRNFHTAALAEAIVLRFAVIKAAQAGALLMALRDLEIETQPSE